MLWIKSAIFYSIGALITTMLIFNFVGVKFYSGNTYGANDYEKSYQQTQNINLTNNKISTNSLKKDESSAYWSRVITAALIIMIILKIVLYFLARRNNIITIKQALINQGKDFFNILQKNVDIGSNETNNKEDNPFENKPQNGLKQEYNKYYILYYQIDLDEQSKIQFNISNHDYLKNKTFNSYSYELFGKEEDDILTLKKLNNLVIVYTSPETIPDERFKKNMMEILESNVNDIWIIPLKHNMDSLQLLRKDDKDYKKWEKVIANIDNNHVRIHFDV